MGVLRSCPGIFVSLQYGKVGSYKPAHLSNAFNSFSSLPFALHRSYSHLITLLGLHISLTYLPLGSGAFPPSTHSPPILNQSIELWPWYLTRS